MDKETERQLKKLEEFKSHLIQIITDVSPLVQKAMNNRDKGMVQELLVQFFVDNVDILNKIVVTRNGKGERFTRKELDAIKENLLNITK